MKFYRRRGQGIELTEQGHAFLRRVGPILKQIENLKGDLDQREKNDGEPLVVAGSYGLSAIVLPSVLALYRKTHTTVPITLRTVSSTVASRLVSTMQVEIAVAGGATTSFRLRIEPFLKHTLVAFVPSDHRFAKRSTVTLADFVQAPLVVRGANNQRTRFGRFLVEMENKGLNPQVAMHCDSAEAVKTAVKKGMGIGILYEDIVQTEIKNGDFRLVRVPEFNLEGQSFIIYQREKPLSANAEAFLTLLRQWQTKSPQARTFQPIEVMSSK